MTADGGTIDLFKTPSNDIMKNNYNSYGFDDGKSIH